MVKKTVSTLATNFLGKSLFWGLRVGQHRKVQLLQKTGGAGEIAEKLQNSQHKLCCVLGATMQEHSCMHANSTDLKVHANVNHAWQHASEHIHAHAHKKTCTLGKDLWNNLISAVRAQVILKLLGHRKGCIKQYRDTPPPEQQCAYGAHINAAQSRSKQWQKNQDH